MTETPDQYKTRTGTDIPDNTVVWMISPFLPQWNNMIYSAAKQITNVTMIIADSNGKPDIDYESRGVLGK